MKKSLHLVCNFAFVNLNTKFHEKPLMHAPGSAFRTLIQTNNLGKYRLLEDKP